MSIIEGEPWSETKKRPTDEGAEFCSLRNAGRADFNVRRRRNVGEKGRELGGRDRAGRDAFHR